MIWGERAVGAHDVPVLWAPRGVALLRRFPCWFLTKGFSVSQESSLSVSRTQVQEPAGTRLQEGPSGLPTRGHELCRPQRAATVRCLVCSPEQVGSQLPPCRSRPPARGHSPRPPLAAWPPCSRALAPCGVGRSALSLLAGRRPSLAGRKLCETTIAAFSWDTTQCW